MEDAEASRKAHVMVLPYHGQGHMNPLLQFSKRLAAKGIKVTVTTTLSNTKAMPPSSGLIAFESIFDDIAQGGVAGQGGFKGFLERFEAGGSRNMIQLIREFHNSENPVKCLIYDANINWASKITDELRIGSAAFITQSCSFIAGIYPMYCDLSGVPQPVPLLSIQGLPELRAPDMPSFGPETERYPPIIKLILRQFDSFGKADWVLFNSFRKLEEEVVNWMLKLWPAVRTIGPSLPSDYLDGRLKGDADYGFNIYNPNSDACTKWLDAKEKRSVVYVSFGSVASLSEEQTAELSEALVNSGESFLWVVKASKEYALPTKFFEENPEKGLVVKWCPQLAVLAHDAVGCFVSHCGWNSVMEAVSLGVPLVAMPQFVDQTTNAHFVEFTWKVGIQPQVDGKGFVGSDEINRCIQEIMHGERGKEIRSNVSRWKALAKEAMDEGGSSDTSIDEIIHWLDATVLVLQN